MAVGTIPVDAASVGGSPWTRARFVVTLGVMAITMVVITRVADVPLMADAGTHLLRSPILLVLFLCAYGSAFYLRALAWSLLAPALRRSDAS